MIPQDWAPGFMDAPGRRWGLFVLSLYVSVNSYGHVETVSLPKHTFSCAILTKPFTSTLCTYVRL